MRLVNFKDAMVSWSRLLYVLYLINLGIPHLVSSVRTSWDSYVNEYVHTTNVMLSGPDVASKSKLMETIEQYKGEKSSDEIRKWSMKLNSVKSMLTGNQWYERQLFRFIQNDMPGMQLWVQVNLGELLETNELAQFFLPGQFFHFVCVNAASQQNDTQLTLHDSHASLNQSSESIAHKALHSISSLFSKATSPRSFVAAVVCYFDSMKKPSKRDTVAIDTTIKNSLQSCGCCQGKMIKYCAYRKDQLVFPVTNKSNDDYADRLKNTIDYASRQKATSKAVPVSVSKFLTMC